MKQGLGGLAAVLLILLLAGPVVAAEPTIAQRASEVVTALTDYRSKLDALLPL